MFGLLTQSSVVQCMHGGQAKPIMTYSRVKVNKQHIILLSTPYSITTCSNPPQAGGPCVLAQWITSAIRVKALGQPVLLSTSQAICTPVGTGVQNMSNQTQVKGV